MGAYFFVPHMLPSLPQDKANHALYGNALFAVGALLASFVGLPAVAGGVSLTSAAALLKEAYDKASGKGTPDRWDVVATIAGALPPAALLLILL